MSANIVTTLPLGPLDPERTDLLLRVVEGLEPSTLQWLSGFAAGVAHERASGRLGVSLPAGPVVAPAARAEPTARLTIVYGSQTGNSKRIAERLGRAAEAAGLAARVYAAGNYPVKDLARERMLVMVVSTQGDGDPPDDARGLIEFLQSRRAPKLEQLSFSVLALGDSSYPKFCETGRQVDERLGELGAKRLVDRVDCDVDYDTLANAWLDRVVTGARDTLGGSAQSATVTRLRTAPVEPQFSREQPFAAEVIANHSLTGRGATKEVRHVEISLAGSGLTYAPGDALGVWHENPPAVVSEVLQALRLDGEQTVELDGATRPLREWLTTGRELTRLTRPFLTQQAERSQDARLADVLQPGHETDLRRTLKDLQVVDVLQRHPGEWDAKSFVQALRPLAPRLYSIASSQEAVGEEAHLTVALVDYELDRKRRVGAASAFLASLQGDQARGAGLHRRERTLPPPGRHVARRDHDRPRHGCRPVPRLRAAPRGAGRHGPQLALLRCASLPERVPVPDRVAGRGQAGRAEPLRPRVFARPQHRPRVRPGPPASRRQGPVCVARERRVPLRLRRRRADGARRECGTHRHRRGAWRQEP